MKKHIRVPYILGFLCFLTGSASYAQVSFGAGDVILKNGTTISIDGLTLTPDADLMLNNKTVQTSTEAIAGSPTNSIQRVYTFNEAFNFQGVIGMFYLPAELNGNNETDLQIAKSGITDGAYLTTTGSSVDPVSHYVSNTLNSDIRILSAVAAESALPVTLTSFSATKENQTALLSWTTSSEINADFFEVQHSPDGKNWQQIGRIKANGESKTRLTYSFNAMNPVFGENFYRLQMVDLDKSFAFSRIKSLRFNDVLQSSIFPNPVVDKVQVNVSDWNKIQQVQIIAASGKEIARINQAELRTLDNRSIAVKSLVAGIYILKVTNADGVSEVFKMVKN